MLARSLRPFLTLDKLSSYRYSALSVSHMLLRDTESKISNSSVLTNLLSSCEKLTVFSKLKAGTSPSFSRKNSPPRERESSRILLKQLLLESKKFTLLPSYGSLLDQFIS